MFCYHGDLCSVTSDLLFCYHGDLLCSVTKMLKEDAEDLITAHEFIQLLLLKEHCHQHCKVKPSESSQSLGKSGRGGGRRE